RERLAERGEFALGIDYEVLNAPKRLLEELANGARLSPAAVGLDERARCHQSIEVDVMARAAWRIRERGRHSAGTRYEGLRTGLVLGPVVLRGLALHYLRPVVSHRSSRNFGGSTHWLRCLSSPLLSLPTSPAGRPWAAPAPRGVSYDA